MLSALGPVRSLLLAIFVLMSGSGVLSTLVSLRLERAGAGAVPIGIVGAAYFAGLTLGSLRAPAVIARVGHIRAFSAFVAVLSAGSLALVIHRDPAFWALLRFANGLCLAGVYVCLESWLNTRAEGSSRGTVLAAYMVALYAGQAVGQPLLTSGRTEPALPFVVAAMLTSLAIVPVALTRSSGPASVEHPRFPLRRLYGVSPLGAVGVTATGLMLGAFYGMAAVHVRRLGADLPATTAFMTAVILGGVALQWPLGWLSDRFDRRLVVLGAFAAAAAVSAGLALVQAPGPGLMALGALFGGVSFALYPLCVAHANDRLEGDERTGASSGLVLLYSAGAAVGPLGAAAAMAAFGGPGLFGFVAAVAGLALVFGVRRLGLSRPVPAALQRAYQALPRTTPMTAALEPADAPAEDG